MQRDNFQVKSYPSIDTVGLCAKPHRLRVCIVTEEIIGPVRNGGIASTYYHLSRGLAANGHEVHVLLLTGPVVEDETPEHWVAHFAEFGVTLHYLNSSSDPCWGTSLEWQRHYVGAYRWLRENGPFDVVHTSEWRGGAVYALMAKRLGLAFEETLFLVKASSPHIWNRHYQMQPLKRRDLLLVAYAEQKCIELADVMIGGSAHLVSFMDAIGYRMPKANVFVQPNLVDFSRVPVTDRRPPRKPGDIVKTREFVFFGRLEGRKGVELMCNALDILKERGVAPSRVTFMGKWGAPLATRGDMAVEDYLVAKSQAWSFPVEFITDKNQPEALSHICSRDMIAIMPSLIENSTMAVYEALEKNIPFVATSIGGTPELISRADHQHCLVEPNATALANRLEAILADGQQIANASFSNEGNLRVWYEFHSFLGSEISKYGAVAAARKFADKIDGTGIEVSSTAYIVLVRPDDTVASLADALCKARPDYVTLGFSDAKCRPDVLAAAEKLQAIEISVNVADHIGIAAGEALNLMAESQDADVLVVAHGASFHPKPGFFEAARIALGNRPTCLFTSFFEADEGILGMPIGGDLASHFLSSRAYGPELFAMHRDTYQRLGQFEPYDVRCGILHEYVARAVMSGPDDLLVFPERLLCWPKAVEEQRQMAGDAHYAYLKAKPLIDQSEISQRKILLATLDRTHPGMESLGDSVLRDAGRDEQSPHWLVPADWKMDDFAAASSAVLSVAIDESSNTLWFLARGRGERRLVMRGQTITVESVCRSGEKDQSNFTTLSRYNLPSSWRKGTSYQLSWGIYQGDERLNSQFLRVNKIGPNTFALSSRRTIFTHEVLQQVFSRHRQRDTLEATFDLDEASLADDILEATDTREMRPLVDSTPQDELTGVVKEGTLQRVQGLDIDRGLGVPALLELATESKHDNLERRVLRQKSQELIQTLGDREPDQKGEIRAALNVSKSRPKWQRNGWLTGWAWDKEDRRRVLHIALLRDEKPVFMAAANSVMPMLGRRTPGLELHGYRIPILNDFMAPGPIRIVVWENRMTVQNGHLSSVAEEFLCPEPPTI